MARREVRPLGLKEPRAAKHRIQARSARCSCWLTQGPLTQRPPPRIVLKVSDQRMCSGHAADRLAEGVLDARVACATMSAHRCVTERIGAHTCLQNRVCSPPPALLCELARHLGQFDRVGVLEGAQAVRWHPQAAVVPWLWAPAVTARSRVRVWQCQWLGGSLLGVVDILT